MHRLSAGNAFPLGATFDGKGVNFAVFSANAAAMRLCLLDPQSGQVLQSIPFVHRSFDVWHLYLAGASAGLHYALQADGPWDLNAGHRFQPGALLLDPYAREIHASEHGLRAVVVADSFDWEDDRQMFQVSTAGALYEMHVKGFSECNPALPESLRGTYAGLTHPTSLAHLKQLGVSAVSLLPVHYKVSEKRLQDIGLSNYWGYNTIGFFALNQMLAARPEHARDEFRQMVKTLHRNGIAVILDVVYNHTAESDEFGPTYSFRGLDNASYYRLQDANRANYVNYSGCGNILDFSSPAVVRLVMDSLRYWVSEFHVDGFRFDLAPVLGRDKEGFSKENALFRAIAQDPLLAGIKMIAEPWDLGPNGYQLGAFPDNWLEWNDRFRDTMRSYWIRPEGSSVTRGEFARRFCASSDIFEQGSRRPHASVNYVVAHDGFTLRDLLSYAERNNHANGENNRDGHGHNLNRDCGSARQRIARALLASNLLAQGTPMLCAGDEIGKTQQGNNNAYCQDNAISWLDWTTMDQPLYAFTCQVTRLRHACPELHSDTWFEQSELHWRLPSGSAPGEHDWHDAQQPCLGAVIEDRLVLLFNPLAQATDFVLPAGCWKLVLDSSQDLTADSLAREVLNAPAHSLLLLTRTTQ